MTKLEKQQWDELYDYVKIDVLGYTDKILPKEFVLRLRGLSQGKFMANKNITSQASYTFKEILLTFKLCNSKIESAFRSVSFTDEKHRFNYIMRIIESEINNTVDMIKRKQNAEAKADITNYDSVVSDKAEYVTKSKGVNNKLKGLL